MDAETSRRLQREYVESRIRSAHPLEVVTTLYQVAIDNLNAAIECLKTQDRLGRSRTVTRAQQAVRELLVALDHSVDPSFSHSLASLYRYVLERTIEGHSRQSEAAFREALSVLSTLEVAWREIKDQACGHKSEPVEEEKQPEPLEEAVAVKNPYASYQQDREAPRARNWSC